MRRRHLPALLLGSIAGAAARADLVRLIESSRASVVAVGTYDALRNPRFSFRGTGFAVGGGSWIATNAHVLPRDARDVDRLSILIPRTGGAPDVRSARLRVKDETHDLALLEIDGAPLPPLALAMPLPRAGTDVALVGFPLGTALGFVPVTHRGIVAAVVPIALPPPTARQLDAATLSRLRDGAFEVLQLDATAYPGNSGSPLFDVATGQVVGVVNMVFVKSTKESALSQPTGITYAIPARHVGELIERR